MTSTTLTVQFIADQAAHKVAQADAVIAKLAAALADTRPGAAFHALTWADSAIAASAEQVQWAQVVDIAARCASGAMLAYDRNGATTRVELCAPDAKVDSRAATASDVIAILTRHFTSEVQRGAKYPSRSTSPSHNACEVAKLAAQAEIVEWLDQIGW